MIFNRIFAKKASKCKPNGNKVNSNSDHVIPIEVEYQTPHNNGSVPGIKTTLSRQESQHDTHVVVMDVDSISNSLTNANNIASESYQNKELILNAFHNDLTKISITSSSDAGTVVDNTDKGKALEQSQFPH
jgi:hypothetical protein